MKLFTIQHPAPPKSKSLSLSLPIERYNALEAIAKAEGIRMAEVARQMIAHCLEAMDEPVRTP